MIEELLQDDEITDPQVLLSLAWQFVNRPTIECDAVLLRSVCEDFVRSSIDRVQQALEELFQQAPGIELNAHNLITDDLIERGWIESWEPELESELAGEMEWESIPVQPVQSDWPWPITKVQTGGSEKVNLGFEKDKSGLFVCGYRVGKTRGMPEQERRRFLSHFFTSKLPPIVSLVCGDEYGEPRSSQRLQKMANVIAGNCRNFKRNDPDLYEHAILDYEDDLLYLKLTYYQPKTFPWPSVTYRS